MMIRYKRQVYNSNVFVHKIIMYRGFYLRSDFIVLSIDFILDMLGTTNLLCNDQKQGSEIGENCFWKFK